MYSQCPECHARFRVTAAALRAANGTVRCGRCGSAFNALATLSDTLPDPIAVDTATAAAAGIGPAPPQGAELVYTTGNLDQVLLESGDWTGGAAAVDAPQSGGGDATPDGAAQPVLVSEGVPSEDITLEGERIRIDSLEDLDLDLAAKDAGGELDLDLAAREAGSDLDLDLAAKDAGGELDLDLAASEVGGDLDLDLAAREIGRDLDLDLAAREIEGDLDLNFDAEPIGRDLDLNFDAEEAVRDLDSTDEFKIIDDVPDSAWPAEEPASPATASSIAAQDVIAPAAAPRLVAAPALPAQPAAAPPQPAARPVTAVPPAVAPAASSPAVAAPIASAPAVAVPEPDDRSLHVLLETPAARTTPARAPTAASDRPGNRPTGTITAGTPADLRWRRREAIDEVEEPAPARGRAVGWALGCLVLALALLAQVAQQYRQQLVRHPQVGPVLRAAYERLGLPLSPNWDVGAFELRQWGNDGPPGASGQITVRASLTNRAAFAQPHPLLRLEFDDRYGEALASRDFQPAEYLRNSADATRLLAPGASADVELVIVDPGKDAVGYQLDACLPESPTVLRCTRGPG